MQAAEPTDEPDPTGGSGAVYRDYDAKVVPIGCGLRNDA
jgi:hypothetical protein